MKKLLLLLLLCSSTANADSGWVVPLLGGVVLGNILARPYYQEPPVYYQAPPVYYQAPPVYYQQRPVVVYRYDNYNRDYYNGYNHRGYYDND